MMYMRPVNQFLLIVKTNNFLGSVEKSLSDDQKMWKKMYFKIESCMVNLAFTFDAIFS